MLFLEAQGGSVPKIGLGTWLLKGENCVQAVKDALACGYRHIDTAQIYENEAEVGQGIAESGVARSDIFLTTKIWRDHVRGKHLEASLDESLRKLRTDAVDLLLIHWPVPDVPFDETMDALMHVQQKGKARLIGVSNFTTTQMHQCKDVLKVPLATNQVEYHPFLSQQPVLDFLRSHDMFLTAYSPLGRSKFGEDATLQAIASHHGKSVGQVILRWHMQQPDVVAIPKSGTKAHIEANIDIFDFALSDEEMTAITELTLQHKRLINPDFAPKWDVPAAA
jgi:2,5-diketo-D-gluconate reductase B